MGELTHKMDLRQHVEPSLEDLGMSLREPAQKAPEKGDNNPGAQKHQSSGGSMDPETQERPNGHKNGPTNQNRRERTSARRPPTEQEANASMHEAFAMLAKTANTRLKNGDAIMTVEHKLPGNKEIAIKVAVATGTAGGVVGLFQLTRAGAKAAFEHFFGDDES